MTLEFDSIEKHPKFLYGDEDLIVMLAVNPIAAGQLQIFPREHFTIAEQVPDNIIGKMFNTANQMSSVLFDNINCEGTNIIVNNGIPAGQNISRFSINIIPRRDKDGLNLLWTPQHLPENQISAAATRLQEYAKNIGKEEAPSPVMKFQESSDEEKQKAAKTNYKLKQLRRMP